MPELAEVEYYRKQWDPARKQKIQKVRTHPDARIYRDCSARKIQSKLEGKRFLESFRHGKQMLFRFSEGFWLNLHLGMTGKLMTAEPELVPAKAEHLVLVTNQTALVFSDYRMFGKVELFESEEFPDWWKSLPAEVLSNEFNRDAVGSFLQRRSNSPIKAVLLMQEMFPGIGNWMADEILWRAGIHPACLSGKIKGIKLSHLYDAIIEVSEDALRVIGTDWNRPPDSWLFNHRWKDGGKCPKTETALQREKIGGRTTCFSPKKQSWPEPQDRKN